METKISGGLQLRSCAGGALASAPCEGTAKGTGSAVTHMPAGMEVEGVRVRPRSSMGKGIVGFAGYVRMDQQVCAGSSVWSR